MGGHGKGEGERLAKNSRIDTGNSKADSAALARMLSAEPDINPAVHHSEYSLIFRPTTGSCAKTFSNVT